MRRLIFIFLLFLFPLSADLEKTLAIVKPNGVKNRHVGDIISLFERGGLTIEALKVTQLSLEEASSFYSIHKDKPFFDNMVKFMSSGRVVAILLKGENGVQTARQIIGATDPKLAASGTIRSLYGESIDANAVHGSDSVENGQKEILFFFPSS